MVLLYEDMHEAGKATLREKAEILFATSFERLIPPLANDC